MRDLGERLCEKEGEVIKPRQLGMGIAVQFVAPVLKSESKRSFDTTLGEKGREKEREVGGGGAETERVWLDTTLGERERWGRGGVGGAETQFARYHPRRERERERER